MPIYELDNTLDGCDACGGKDCPSGTLRMCGTMPYWNSVSVVGRVSSCAGVCVGVGVANDCRVVLGVANYAGVAHRVDCMRVWSGRREGWHWNGMVCTSASRGTWAMEIEVCFQGTVHVM